MGWHFLLTLGMALIRNLKSNYQDLLKNYQNRKVVPINNAARPSGSSMADFKASDPSLLQEGMKVEHPKFGMGLVTEIDERGSNKKAIIDFQPMQPGDVKESFAEINKSLALFCISPSFHSTVLR